ncbi:MAG TPA: hypothetical protein VFS80_11620, partial [Burkholderiales bacterium]|nr:hypothetical protein [Burkholderiales bacterium]
PVNDDTDIFLANPQFTATRPNVFIFVDNSANWSQSSSGVTKYDGVRAGLTATISNVVTDNFNVGLGLFVETGSPNNNVDGGYLRYGIRRMTGTAGDTNTNKGKLIAMINALDQNGDKGNGAVYSLAMAEMFKYFAGLTSTSGHGKQKADGGGSVYFSTGRQALAGSPLPANALPNVSAASAYTSPIIDACQKNFIIFISNGEANDNSSAIAAAESMFTADTGATPTQIPLSPSGAEAIVADEYARYMANGDCNLSIPGIQNVYTYTLDILPNTTGQGPAHTALLKSMASNGKGKYFAINDITTTAEIEAAIRSIFQEVQAVNSVFASTTLPVSVNVRGTNLNQVYIGVFRPDENRSPRWLGNLKLYRLGVNTATDELFLADATGAAAENSGTGFISANARSFWTDDEAVDFWRYRDAAVNGAGGTSDLPDGDLVEKGGAGQQLRVAYATDQSSRSLYTCLNASTGTCDGTSKRLASTPFNTANLSPADVGAYPTVGVASMSAAEDLPANPGSSIVTVVTGAAHGLGVGGTVRIEGASPAAFNGDFQVLSAPIVTSFTYRIPVVLQSDRARVVSGSHGMNSGDLAFIDTAPNEYDAPLPGSAVTRIDENTFEYMTAAPPVTPHTGPLASQPKSRKPVSALSAPPGIGTTARAVVPGHNYGTIGAVIPAPGVTITGANETAFNCTPGSITILAADSFSYATCGTLSGASNTGQATVAAHTFTTGSNVRIRDTGSASYDGLDFSITRIDGNTFTFPVASGPAISTGFAGVVITSIAYPFSGGTQNTAVVTTATPHGFTATAPATVVEIVGTQGLFTGGGGCPGHNTTAGAAVLAFTVTATPSPTTFHIAAARQCPAYSGTPAGAVAGFAISSIVPIISATGTIYSETDLSITSITPLGTATGNVTAGDPTIGDTTARDQIVAWVRGQDNSENENQDCTNSPYWPCGATNFIPRTTDIRASIHGDVLHSRPAVVNYNRYGDDNDIYAYYGSNGGMLHALKGGIDFHASGPDAARTPGSERWALVVKEFFSKLKRLRSQVPSVSAATPKDYFFDGSIGVYQRDAKGNGDAVVTPLNCDPADTGTCSDATVSGVIGDNVHATKGDKVHIYLTMRRGGEFIYALDVTNPGDPKLLWRKARGDAGWEEFGQSWSEPRIARVKADLGNASNPDNVVLIFGAGYEPAVEDLNPCLTESWSTTSVVRKAIGAGAVTFTATGTCTIAGATGGTTTFDRLKGRGILVVDAFSGQVVWQAGGALSTSSAAGARKLNVPGMTCAIASDTTVLDKNRDGFADRIYAGDTCGQVWRVDIATPDMDEWTVTRIAGISSGGATDIVNKRKFLFPPDIVFGTDGVGNYAAVLMGTGDREHPFDTNVVNAFYMFKDRDSSDPGNPQAGATNSTSVKIASFATTPTGDPTTHDNPGTTGVFDATNTEGANDRGWKIHIGSGEKVVSSAVTISGTTFFNTNQPSSAAGGGACGSNLGIAREYLVGFADAAATVDLNASGTISISDRSTIHSGGGYLPSPVPVVVEIDGKRYQAVISGTSVQSPPGLALEKRTRVYWYKEVE